MTDRCCRVFVRVVLLLACAATPVLANEEPVQLTSGRVTGVPLDHGVTVYRGIPFAAPPVGDLRWKPPAPPIPWVGVRAADAFGPACMQRQSNNQYVRTRLLSEDCLYLNVWSPVGADEERRPVMVWIHGGGWSSGASSVPIYDGSRFAEKGIVLVSVNYRMNAFGFLAHPALSAESPRGVSGNYGILDHVAALEWVRDNIEGFGGDPDNVTIFGESAGAASVYALLATPLAKGLFHKAIAQSTWITPSNVTHLTRHNGFADGAEATGASVIHDALTGLGRATDGDVLNTMREMTAAEIMDLRFSVSLVEDGWVLPSSPTEIFAAGAHNAVPLLAGVNDGEGLLFVRPDDTFSTLDEQREARLAEWGEHGRHLATHYLADTPEDLYASEVDYGTDLLFARGSRQILEANAAASIDTFMYLFTRNLRDPSRRSPHAMELRYVFQTLPDDAPAVDRDISDLMNDYWVQFATSGRPNRDGLPVWPAYEPDTQSYRVIGAEGGTGTAFRGEQLDALDRYVAATYDSARP